MPNVEYALTNNHCLVRAYYPDSSQNYIGETIYCLNFHTPTHPIVYYGANPEFPFSIRIYGQNYNFNTIFTENSNNGLYYLHVQNHYNLILASEFFTEILQALYQRNEDSIT